MVIGEFTKVPLSIGQEQVHSRVIDVLGQAFDDVDKFGQPILAEKGHDFSGRVLFAPSRVGLVNALPVGRLDGLGMTGHEPCVV